MRCAPSYYYLLLLWLFLLLKYGDGNPSSVESSLRVHKRSTPTTRVEVEQANVQQKKTTAQVFEIAWRKALNGGVPGMIAGAIQVLALMWLRTITNYQYRYGTSLKQSISILYKQGGICRLYEGLGFALIQGPLSRLGSTAANEGVIALMKNLQSTKDIPLFFSTALASAVAGIWRICLMPIDTAKVVMQVEGPEGFKSLMRRVRRGQLSALYQGAIATCIAAMLGHLPWFTTYSYLNHGLAEATTLSGRLIRNGFIGFTASAVSDTVSNSIRVVKTTKQAAASLSSVTYGQAIQIVLAADGWQGLFGRGLGTRILANGLQSILFTIIWNGLKESHVFKIKNPTGSHDDDDSSKGQKEKDGKGSLRGSTSRDEGMGQEGRDSSGQLGGTGSEGGHRSRSSSDSITRRS